MKYCTKCGYKTKENVFFNNKTVIVVAIITFILLCVAVAKNSGDTSNKSAMTIEKAIKCA